MIRFNLRAQKRNYGIDFTELGANQHAFEDNIVGLPAAKALTFAQVIVRRGVIIRLAGSAPCHQMKLAAPRPHPQAFSNVLTSFRQAISGQVMLCRSKMPLAPRVGCNQQTGRNNDDGARYDERDPSTFPGSRCPGPRP